MRVNPIVVVDYDPGWPGAFERLRQTIWPAVATVATSIEHVGSTSVPGLAAKPVIGLSVVVPGIPDVPVAIACLADLGYVHTGNLGVGGREAFRSPHVTPRHHLYLCHRESLALRNHLAVRDYLRAHPETARRYGELKKRLAEEHRHDIDGYVWGKTNFMLEILDAAGLSPHQLKSIERINRPPDW